MIIITHHTKFQLKINFNKVIESVKKSTLYINSILT